MVLWTEKSKEIVAARRGCHGAVSGAVKEGLVAGEGAPGKNIRQNCQATWQGLEECLEKLT